MLKMMVRPRQAPCLLLGIGTYYVSAAHNTQIDAHRWEMLEFKNPLIVDGLHARALFRRHRTDAADKKVASAGAWALLLASCCRWEPAANPGSIQVLSANATEIWKIFISPILSAPENLPVFTGNPCPMWWSLACRP